MALKIGTNFGNNYEAIRNTLSTRPAFDQEAWEYSAINGELDAYIDSVYDMDESTFNKLKDEYGYDFADVKTRVWTLFNEKYGDKTVEQTDKYLRTRYKKDEDGNYVLVNGKPQEETYYASDYDYYKEIIKNYNDENRELYLKQLEQQAKDEIHPIGQFFSSLAGVTGEFVSGVWGSVDSLLTGISGLVNATIDSIKGENWSDAYAKFVSDDSNYVLGSKQLEQALTEFERKYSTIRDIDGNYTSAGGFFAGLYKSAGQMIPALVSSYGVGKAADIAGLSSKAVSMSAQVSSSAVFYGSMTIDNVHDTYNYFKQQGISISSSAILANAALKSAAQLAVEIGLGKMLGHFSQLDQLVFGRSAGKAVSASATTLGKSLLNRVLLEFGQEGMEEVLQDTSDWLIDRVFTVIDENFGQLTDINTDDLMLSFLAGGIMSLGGHALGIAKRSVGNRIAQSSKYQAKVLEHNIKVETTGKGKFKHAIEANPLIGINDKTGKAKRLNSALSYEYSLNMQTFMQNFAEILTLGKKYVNDQFHNKMSTSDNFVDKNRKDFVAYQSAVAEMYIAYRLLGSIYTANPEAFAKANEILTQVQGMVDIGRFNRGVMSERVTALVGETMQGIQANHATVIEKLKEAGISRTRGVYDKGVPITDASLDDKTRKALEDLMTSADVDRVVVTEDGKHLVITNGVAFVQIKQLQNGGADSIYESMAEETMVNALIDGDYHGVGIKEVTKLYREVSGRPDATEHEAALSLFLNDSFFRIMLSTANKDTLQLLTSLVDIEKKVVPDKQRTAKYKQKLNQVIENMHKAVYQYALNNIAVSPDDFTILSSEEKKRVKATHWCKNLYRRVASKTAYKKLTDDDWKVLTNRVNAMPVDTETKTKILANLKSNNELVRISAMNAIAAAYKNIFTSAYDGKTYMPDNSIPNRVFNTFLQQNELTISTLKSDSVAEEIKQAVTEAFGEFNINNLIKYYQTQFGAICNNAWTFTIDNKNNVSIYETKTKIQVGFSEYKEAYENKDWMMSRNLSDNTNIERAGRRHDALGKLLHPNLSIATAAYTTIDDVIVNPSLLSDDVKRKIAAKYGTVDSETTFRYLQNYFIDTTKNTTVIVLQDGSYAFGNVRPMQKILRNSDRKFTVDDKFTVKQLIAERYLYGRLADISITTVTAKSSKAVQSMMTGSIAAYDSSTNTIYLNSAIFDNYSQDFIKFAILHEFQHAMQIENGMNLGLNVNWLLNDDINITTRRKLVEDIRRHCPEIFNEKSYGENKIIIPGSQIEARIAQEFVYYCSGESTAYGVDAQAMINFYPFVVSSNEYGKEELKTPWGTKYSLSTGMPVSLFIRTAADEVVEILSTDKYKNYENAPRKESDGFLAGSLMKGRNYTDAILHRNPAFYNYYHSPLGTEQNISAKKEAVAKVITPEIKEFMLRGMYADSNLAVSFEEFLEMDVPVIRVQTNVINHDDAFLSASFVLKDSKKKFDGNIQYLLISAMRQAANDIEKYVIAVGTIKPKDIIGYLGTELYEVLLPVSTIENFKKLAVTEKYNVNHKAISDMFEAIDVETLIESGDLVNAENKYQQDTSLGSIDEEIDRTKIQSMAAPIDDENKKSKKKPKHIMLEEDNSKRKNKTLTGGKGLNRIYVSQAMGKDTALEEYGYTGQYKRTYMSKGTYDFLRKFNESLLSKDADGKLNDADEILLEALKSGKATSRDILDYLRNATDMSDEMFKLINDSFFHNKFITTFNDLQKRINESGDYYALRTIMKVAGLNEKFIENADKDLFTQAVQLLARSTGKVKYGGKTVEINKLFEQISTRYQEGAGQYSEKLLRRLWMQYYDGTAATGGYIAGIARWAMFANVNVTGEGESKVKMSTNQALGDTDLTLEDVSPDTSDAFAELFDNMSVVEKMQQVITALSLLSGVDIENIDSLSDKKRKQYNEWVHKSWLKLDDMSDKSIDKYFDKIYKQLTDAQRQTLIRMSLAIEAGTQIKQKLNEKQQTELHEIAEKAESMTNMPSSEIANRMRGLLRTIKNNVPEKRYWQILEDNSDILDKNLKLKTDNMLEKRDKRTVYKSPEQLIPYLDRIKKLTDDVKAGQYDSIKSKKAASKMERELEKIKAANERLKQKLAKASTKVIQYNVQDNTIEIESDRQIPTALKRMLDNTFTKTAPTKIQYLTEQDDSISEEKAKQHIKMDLSAFVEMNAEYLTALTQSDVDEIIDFYLHSEIIPTTNKARQYAATRIYLLSYFLTNKLGTPKGKQIDTRGTAEWLISEEQRNAITENIENVISINAAVLSAWKATMSTFKPEKLIIASLAKRNDLEFAVEDIDNLVDAVQSRDPERIKSAQARMYENGLKKYTQLNKKLTVDSFLGKVLSFERMCMLSGPGTWIRNWSSNFLVEGGNWASGKVGQLISNALPKKWKNREGQYKIVGTKVDTTTKNFVTEQIVKSGLLKLLGNSLSKYDVRKSKQAAVSTDESIIELLKESIRSRILYDNGYNNKILDLVNRGMSKILSDNRWIDKQTIYYLSRTLIEDNVDLSEGLTKQVIEHLADAYRMAAQDYMHKTNIFNVLEAKIQEKLGMKGYFIYKQILPFASAGWNWFVEGLNYTPIGLAKSIIQYAKLENTIKKLEDAQQKGDFSGIPAGFAQYRAIRNLGKGVLGTIGTIAGVLLAAFGVAGIDEEDDKYKLRIGDVYIDISSLFGSQGILMGISVTSAIVDSMKDDDNVADKLWSLFKTTLDATFADSTLDDIVSTFRYSSNVGDWLSNIPFTMVGMMVPNFLKQLLSFAPTKSVQYSKGLQGKLEKMVVQNLPLLAYAFPKQVDPYTGDTQVPYVATPFFTLLNKMLPFKVAPYRFSDTEKTALSLGLKKGQLTGSYEINGQKVKLKSSEVHSANTYYGKLNKKDLDAFTKNKTSYKVWDEKKNKYVTLKYSQMTDKQKANVIDRIMSNNASLAKIYILTSTGQYKYFANTSEYKELRQAGITKNIYKETGNKSGFIK